MLKQKVHTLLFCSLKNYIWHVKWQIDSFQSQSKILLTTYEPKEAKKLEVKKNFHANDIVLRVETYLFLSDKTVKIRMDCSII